MDVDSLDKNINFFWCYLFHDCSFLIGTTFAKKWHGSQCDACRYWLIVQAREKAKSPMNRRTADKRVNEVEHKQQANIIASAFSVLYAPSAALVSSKGSKVGWRSVLVSDVRPLESLLQHFSSDVFCVTVSDHFNVVVVSVVLGHLVSNSGLQSLHVTCIQKRFNVFCCLCISLFCYKLQRFLLEPKLCRLC